MRNKRIRFELNVWIITLLVVFIALLAIGFSRQILESQRLGNEKADLLSEMP